MRVFTLLLALMVSALSDLQGQEQLPGAQGQRVRLKTCRTYAECTYFVGTVTTVGADVIHLETDSDGLVMPFPELAIRKLELYRGRGPSTKEGALVGGLTFGLLSGIALSQFCSGWSADNESCAGGFALGFFSGVVPGAALGALIGSAIRKDKWDEVTFDQLLVEPVAAAAVVQAVLIAPEADTLAIGERIQLVATAYNYSANAIPNKTFTWSSSNDAIASVSNAGLVTAHANGSVVIAANADNIVGTANIVVGR